MECCIAREAISSLIDGEDPGVTDDALQAHLAGCGSCRGWQQRAHAVTRRIRLGGSFLPHDLTSAVLAAVPVAPVPRARLAWRAGLIAVAMAQLAITVPLLILGHDQDAGAHAAHELGSFDLALAIAFLVGAIRPVLSAGLVWPCGVAATGLAGTAIADLISGQAIGADEAQHLVGVCGAALLFWQARACARRRGPARTVASAGPGNGVATAAPVAASWPVSPLEAEVGGTDVARGTGPGVAARQRTPQPWRDGDSTAAVA